MSIPIAEANNKHIQACRNAGIPQFPVISREQAHSLLSVVSPVTFASTDLQGRTIQLWKYKHLLVASIEENNTITLIPGSQIHNALLPHENGNTLLERLSSGNLKKWHFSYKQGIGEIYIWPFLTAAGRDKYDVAYENVLALQHKDRRELTPTQAKLLNITRDHFKGSDLGGAKKESDGIVLMRDGKPLLNKAGRPFDHIKEVRDGQRGVKNVIETLKAQLKATLDPKARNQIIKELSLASNLLTYTERYILSNPGRQPYQGKESEGQSANQKGSSSKNTSPAAQAFQQRVQQTRLTDSYNSTHSQNPILPKGATGGSIGGVACSTADLDPFFGPFLVRGSC